MVKHKLNLGGICENREWVETNIKTDFGSETKLTEEEIKKMKKEATECRVPIWGWAYETISYFLDNYVRKGENCYCELSWKRVYSIDLLNISQIRGCDLEDAFYRQFYWRPKIEQEKLWEKYAQEREAQQKKDRLEAIEKIPWWIEEGKKYIDEEKWEDREKYVNSSARDMYYWGDIDDTIILLKLIEEWKSWEVIQKIFDENCGLGFYHSVVGNRVIRFSRKGAEAKTKLIVNN
jgi:hypothetical protein